MQNVVNLREKLDSFSEHWVPKVVAELNEEYLADMGLNLRVAADQTAYIRGALRLVRNNLILGGVLAVMVLMMCARELLLNI